MNVINRRAFAGLGLGFMAGGMAAGKLGAESSGDKVNPDDVEAFSARVGREAAALFEKNRVSSSIGVFHIPSIETYRSFFAWDSGWNAISLLALDPEAALTELKTIFNVQSADGHIPHEVRIPEMKETDPLRQITIQLVRRQYDQNGASAFIDPPSFLIAAGLLYEKTGDSRVFELLPAMDRCARYLTEDRDLFGDGLVSIIHPWESGTDSAAVFDAPMGLNVSDPLMPVKALKRYVALLNDCADMDWDVKKIAAADLFVFEDVGMNSITAAGLMSLSSICEASDHPAMAWKWREKAEAMVAAMEKLFWDDEAAFFYPRYDRKSPKSSKRRVFTGALPLITGLVSEDKAARLIEKNLKSPDHFFGPWLVPFNSISELAPEKIPLENFMLWRGHCIWMNMNWMAASCAANYTDPALASEITRSSARLVSSSGFREFYDPRDGKGGGASGFTWPALVLDMISRYGLGQ